VNFLKNLFSGGGRTDDRGIYFYVKPKACQEIVQVRIDPMNDLSRTDGEDGFYVRKLATAHRCPFQAEVEVYFTKNKSVINAEITNGTQVTEAEWQAQEAARQETE